MPTQLDYQVFPPGREVIEASASSEPDDLSVVSIKIEATGDLSNPKRIDFIRFEPVDPSKPKFQGRPEVEGITLLTTNPLSITPVAKDFAGWTFVHEGEGIFKATRVGEPAPQPQFMLHDVEVVPQEGTAAILIIEYYSDGSQKERLLHLRKVFPGLRIDYFRALPNHVQANQAVELSWATTAATRVELFKSSVGGPQGVQDGDEPFGRQLLADPLDPGVRDGSIQVTPRTSTAYTLKIFNDQLDGLAVRQLTLTVTDQAVVQNLVVEGQVEGDLRVEARILAARATINGKLQAGESGGTSVVKGSLSVQESVDAAVVTGIGTMVAGMIVMWSGHSNQIPPGWALCNGSNGTPDLRGRFIVGKGSGTYSSSPSGDSYSYSHGATGGQQRVKLTTSELPSHNHANGEYDRLVRFNTGSDGEEAFDGNGSDNTNRFNLRWHHNIRSVGGNRSHENRPPYFALCYIMKT